MKNRLLRHDCSSPGSRVAVYELDGAQIDGKLATGDAAVLPERLSNDLATDLPEMDRLYDEEGELQPVVVENGLPSS
jgi:hypothetical protein